MPVITRRQPLLDLRGKTGSIALSDARSFQSPQEDDNNHNWLFTEDSYKTPQKEMDFPSPAPQQLRQKSKSRSNLRLTTQSSLHSRYQSSEEEASPSPDDYNSSSDEAISEPQRTTEIQEAEEETEEVPALSDTEDDSSSDYDDTPSTPLFLATRLTLINAGRPRLISIASLAPIQKRKRTIPTPIAATPIHQLSSAQMSPISTNSAYHSAPTSPPPRAAKRPVYPACQPRAKPAPSVWLPYDCEEDQSSEKEEAERLVHDNSCDDDLATLVNAVTSLQSPGEIYFPPEQNDFELDLIGKTISPTPTTYAEYDPYSLDPPRLSGGSHELAYARKYGGVSAVPMQKKGWKGKLGLGKKSNAFEMGMERVRAAEVGRGWAFED